jgi:hypothetical protein
MKRLILGLLLITGFTGNLACSAGQLGKAPTLTNDNDFATVLIARKGGGWVGCGSAILIQLNDQDFIRLDCGMKTTFKIPAKEKTKISQVLLPVQTT